MAKGSTGGRTRICCVFPGQGAPAVGMGDELSNYESANRVFEISAEILGYDVRNLTEEELEKTIYCQPAVLVNNLARFTALTQNSKFKSYDFRLNMGHSLGELCALYASGCFGSYFKSERALKNSLKRVIGLVNQRATFMSECIPDEVVVEGTSHMAAIISKDQGLVERVCEEVSIPGNIVRYVNANSYTQGVISGNNSAVIKAVAKLRAHKGVRVHYLPVQAPFHSDIMKPASREMEKELEGVEIGHLRTLCIMNVTSNLVFDPREIKSLLARQVSEKVLWLGSLEKAIFHGYKTFVECGHGDIQRNIIGSLGKSNDEFKNVEVYSFKDWMGMAA